jgi:hypothetical protein
MGLKCKLLCVGLLMALFINVQATIVNKDSIRYDYFSSTVSITDCDSLYMGFKPIGSEDFKALIKIIGKCSVDTNSNHRLNLTNPYYIISMETGDTISYSLTSPRQIDIATLYTEQGVPVNITSTSVISGNYFFPEYFRFENPEPTSTANSYVEMDGKWKFKEFPDWLYDLGKNSFVRLLSGKAVLPNFTDTVSLDSLKFKGAHFDTLSLVFSHYNDSIFSISGIGVLKFDSARLAVNLGYNGKNGIKIINGRIDSISVMVSSSFHVHNLQMNSAGCYLEYVRADSSYSFYGDTLTMTFNSNEIKFGMGDENSPGAKFKNGKLQHMKFTLMDSTSLFGLILKGKGITFEYYKNHYIMHGGPDTITFRHVGKDANNNDSTSLHSLIVDFGNADDPGLVIEGGKLKHLNIGLSDTLSLMELSLRLHNLHLSYDSDSSYYKLFGGPAQIKYKNDSIAIDFGSSDLPGLLIKNGELLHIHLGLTTSGKLFGLEIVSKNAFIDWDKNMHQYALGGGPVGLKYGSDSIYVTFGTTQDPGIIFKNGKLKKLEGNITENFRVAKLTFQTDSLGFKYLPDKELFEIKQGDVKIKILEDSLKAHFGHDTIPGMVLDDGKLTEFNVKVSSHAKLFKLECDIDSLDLIYNKVDSIFEIYGGPIKFGFEGDTIGGSFGDETNPGVLIKDGKWQKFAMGIDGNFKLSKLEIEPKNLTFAYDIPNKRIVIYNSLVVTIDSIHIDCQFGTASDPGVVIINSQLDTLFMDVNSDIHLGGLELITKDAGIRWSKESKETELFGEYEVKKIWNVDLSIGNDKNPGIIIKENAHGKSTFDIESIKLQLGEVNLGSVEVENLFLEYSKDKLGSPFIEAACTLIISNAFETEAAILLKKINGHWEMDSMQFEFQVLPPEEGIPIGATGLFLQGIGGSIGNLSNLNDLELAADVKISDAVPYDAHPGNPGFLIYIEGDASVNKNLANIDIKLLLGAYYNKNENTWKSDIGNAVMDIYLNWSKHIYKLTGKLYVPSDYGVKVVGNILLSEKVKVFYGDVEIRIPSSWWLIGGKVLGDVGGAMLLFKNDKNASYAAGWTNFKIGCVCCHHWYCGGHWCHCLLDAEVGLKYNFGSKSFSKLGASDISHIKRQATSYFKSTQNQVHSFEINVSENAFGDLLMCKVGLDTFTELRNVNIAVMGPSGMYDLDYFLYDSIQGYYHIPADSMDYYTQKINEVYFFLGETFYEQKYSGNWQDSYNSVPKLVQLEHGQYEVIIDLPYDIEPKFESNISHSNIRFDLETAFNPDNGDIQFTTRYWIPEIPAKVNDAKVWIFADNDSTGYDGRLVADSLTLKELRDNAINVHESSWTPYGHAPHEKYYFYAMLADSFHNQVFSSYSNGIEVETAIQGKFTNASMPDSGIAGITVFLDLNRNGKLDIHELPLKDSLGNTIPQADSSYVLEMAEPSCITDSLGNFYFDVHKTSKEKLQPGAYQLGFYLKRNYIVSNTSPYKRDDDIEYNGTSKQIEIQIEQKQ